MNVKISQLEFCLSKRQTLSVADGAGVRIEAQAGTVWVTQDHDLRGVGGQLTDRDVATHSS